MTFKLNKVGTWAFLRQFEMIVNAGFDDVKAADMTAWCASEIIISLMNHDMSDRAALILKKWLEHSDIIPASAKRKQYYASFAAALLEKYPEMTDEFESKLLSDDYVDISDGRVFSEVFCKIGKFDKAAIHVEKIMQAGR